MLIRTYLHTNTKSTINDIPTYNKLQSLSSMDFRRDMRGKPAQLAELRAIMSASANSITVIT